MTIGKPVDFLGVAHARAVLDEAVQRWPRLVGSEAQDRLADHIQTIADPMNTEATGEETMPRKSDPSVKTQQVGIRLDEDVLARLDAIAEKLSRPGLELTRTDAIRIALETGLKAIEKEK